MRTHVLHEEAELVDVAELLEVVEGQAELARRLVDQRLHGDQVVRQQLQARDLPLLSKTHQ